MELIIYISIGVFSVGFMYFVDSYIYGKDTNDFSDNVYLYMLGHLLAILLWQITICVALAALFTSKVFKEDLLYLFNKVNFFRIFAWLGNKARGDR